MWECFVPDRPDGRYGIPHKSLLRVVVETAPGRWEDRLPAWITRVVQFPGKSVEDGQFWCPGAGERHEWQHEACGGPSSGEGLRIYECHVGMATEEGRIGTYKEFAANVVPYVAAAGYNAVQLMAVMEHAYYASFGYQVTNFFAVAHRFGTPEELKELVDACHAHGLAVLLDVVHSHASKNVADGLSMFDGSDTYLFHAPPRGEHKIWNSRLFDYGNWETLRFLLSNLAWYLEEYRFDGFRFDGVTSILYTHHGIGKQTFDYPHYFRSGAVDGDALAYLTLANELIHRIRPRAVSIAEDVSGFPCLCRPTAEGGVGFDYRLNMAGPDLWVHLLKEVRDEDWHVGDIAWTLTNRRWMERCIGYAESHDQALVGDKTIIFRLIDADMYWHMQKGDENYTVRRGMALHKMIRLVTAAAINGGYLNFMGNEWGHPEWIDFPRDGNGWSHKYARRQWSLVDNPALCYHQLGDFDAAMLSVLKSIPAFENTPVQEIWHNDGDQVMAYMRGPLVFVFNFSPTRSYDGYGFMTPAGCYTVELNTDSKDFGGNGLADDTVKHLTNFDPLLERQGKGWLKLYLPARSAVVLRLGDEEKEKK